MPCTRHREVMLPGGRPPGEAGDLRTMRSSTSFQTRQWNRRPERSGEDRRVRSAEEVTGMGTRRAEGVSQPRKEPENTLHDLDDEPHGLNVLQRPCRSSRRHGRSDHRRRRRDFPSGADGARRTRVRAQRVSRRGDSRRPSTSATNAEKSRYRSGAMRPRKTVSSSSRTSPLPSARSVRRYVPKGVSSRAAAPVRTREAGRRDDLARAPRSRPRSGRGAGWCGRPGGRSARRAARGAGRAR